MKQNRCFHALLTVKVAVVTALQKVRQTREKPITIFCRNAASPRTLFATTQNVNEAQTMPFLFWMPMIVMCGLWRAVEDDARTLFPSQR